MERKLTFMEGLLSARQSQAPSLTLIRAMWRWCYAQWREHVTLRDDMSSIQGCISSLALSDSSIRHGGGG